LCGISKVYVLLEAVRKVVTILRYRFGWLGVLIGKGDVVRIRTRHADLLILD
jgi:hypothetical protein